MSSTECPILPKDFESIISLFNYKEARLQAIGDQFLQHFQNKNATMLCMCLVALYEEHSLVSHVTQRLTISYLVYRLKDMWKREVSEKSGIFSHPYLVILFKMYWNHVSPPGMDHNDRSLIHLLSKFPKITAQEGHFVGRLLTESPSSLSDLFEQSPLGIADNAVTEQPCNIMPIKTFVEEQLHQFRCFSGTPRSANADSRVLSSFSLLNNPLLFNELEKVVYSLVPPNRIPSSSYSPPRYNGIASSYQQKLEQTVGSSRPEIGQNPPPRSEIGPVQGLHRSDSGGSQNTVDSGPLRNGSMLGQLMNGGNGGSGINGGNGVNERLANTRTDDDKTIAMQFFKRVTSGQSLHKTELQKLMTILEEDADIWRETDFDVPQFAKMIELHPELASECLLQEHLRESPLLTKHLNVVLTMEISVQTMISVSRFMCQCDKQNLPIPTDFLNAYITYCIDTCQRASQNNPSAAHRIVRMVCVFFQALLRLNNFNIKPRIAEIFNFATLFSSVKETTQLYQAITQLKNAATH
ncbi:unnamed protein product [Bursaphelenchus okinawaensis]|uniref:CCR4-NOT transcription complex subunit 11 n=1 Tax=Bursaphelenchus okinawaensis TaxID=465554 RepID=A0A811L1J5_9BILA|nr:unnamed protein product [Bursaphelenchus okinawaensis]CAG9115220.1 unnamed protein product [Bursaphelenchus okinawaensis]